MSLNTPNKNDKIIFFTPDYESGETRHLVTEGISAGFPSPAEDFMEFRISLDKTLTSNPEATFYARVKGNSMIDAGINDKDVLVIDRSLEPRDQKIAVCYIDGEFTVKRIKLEKDCLYLMPENPAYQPIKVTTENQFLIWGIVTYVIKKV
ncbi:LexA family protein [Flavobacterium sp. '19STA2R22 D10 B1']|uniref:LexA family protein n=1 Tax=Flavobacterium aerium TaxID=3037261 RepID=UPI00278C10FA|nr:translesion error-prone DNA polymerase V autoproteolytic subunit [Flavobacterium sp. '19STA2R22 D10 B1']